MTVITAVLVANFIVPVFAHAESLDSLNKKENAIMRQSDQISAEIQLVLNDVNEKYAKVEATKEKIAKNEATLTTAQAEIKETQKNIEKRKDAVAQRLKDIQVNGGTERDWKALLDSSNLQELINRAYAMTILQNAEKEKIDSLHNEKEKLESLKDKVESTQATLKENETTLQAEAQELDSKVANLKQQLAENKISLQAIAKSKEVEAARIEAEKQKAEAEKQAAEKAAAEKAAKEQAESEKAKESSSQSTQSETTSSSSSSTSSSDSNKTNSSSSSSTNSNSSNNSNGTSNSSSNSNSSNNTSNTSGGRTMMMESTAYSYSEAGASYFTASGTDLRKNPMAVAVDPSVIPLGTLVEVQGYGMALALDTGGAIKGNIIDVHFPTVEQCRQWGRRQVKVTIHD